MRLHTARALLLAALASPLQAGQIEAPVAGKFAPGKQSGAIGSTLGAPTPIQMTVLSLTGTSAPNSGLAPAPSVLEAAAHSPSATAAIVPAAVDSDAALLVRLPAAASDAPDHAGLPAAKSAQEPPTAEADPGRVQFDQAAPRADGAPTPAAPYNRTLAPAAAAAPKTLATAKTAEDLILENPVREYRKYRARLKKFSANASFPEFKPAVEAVLKELNSENVKSVIAAHPDLGFELKEVLTQIFHVNLEFTFDDQANYPYDRPFAGAFPYRPTIDAIESGLKLLDKIERLTNPNTVPLYHFNRYAYHRHSLLADPDIVIFPTVKPLSLEVHLQDARPARGRRREAPRRKRAAARRRGRPTDQRARGQGRQEDLHPFRILKARLRA
jgi:hypothetical protein